jgi:toxin FitB
MRGILDTSVVIADIAPADVEVAISVATLAELHFGLLVAKDDAARANRLARLSVVEQSLDALPVDEAVARSYGHLASAVVRGHRNPRARAFDLLIAATAHAHDARLYTRNAEDLRGIEGLVDIVAV